MSYTKRTTEQFLKDKLKGQEAEKFFMELIALMGGTAFCIGTVPASADQTPRFSRPYPTSELGFNYAVSPDIIFSLPNQPKGFASLAQVKVKKLQKDSSKGWLFVYLDETELHRMNLAASFYDVYFVINTPELTNIEGYSAWMWLNIDDLQKENVTLIRREICGKPTFLIPINLFKPLNQLTKRQINAAANIDAIPTTATV